MKRISSNRKILFYKQWETWVVYTFSVFEGKNEYICDIVENDLYELCNEVASKKTVLHMEPHEFTSAVWNLLFDKCSFDYYSDIHKEFSNWFRKTVIDWYCEVVQGLI